jgi:hypothetical protein
LKQQHNSANNNTGNNTAATAAAMLAANGYSAAFPFLQHFSAGTTPTPQQQQQLVAAAAALGLPGLPPRFLSSFFIQILLNPLVLNCKLLLFANHIFFQCRECIN